jgi:hypothetical protein
MQDLLNNIESACKLILEAEATGVTVFAGQTEDSQVRPSVTIYAQGGDENPQGSGNFNINLMVAIRSNASDDSIAQHRATCRSLLGAMMEDDLSDQLSAAVSDLHVFGISNRRCREDKEDGSWLTELSFDCYACPMEITA